ncbi:MAG: autotransporter outer membrane beta-barrel domain-containing protein [Sulfitobacter sp.]
MTNLFTDYRHLRSTVLHGWRLTKLKGVVVSVAPMVGATVAPVLLAGASTFAMPAGALAGSCTETGGVGSGVWTCSGPAGADVTQTPTAAPGGSVVVETAPGFGLTAAVGDAIVIVNAAGSSDLTFSDNFGADISGANNGIYAVNSGSGALTVTSTGSVTGTNGLGVAAYNYGTDLTVTGVDATGSAYGFGAANFGTGAVTVTSTGLAVGTNGLGIGTFNSAAGTDLTITAVDSIGDMYGLGAAQFGTGAVTVTSTGTATAAVLDGIYAYSRGGIGTDVTISAVNATGGRNGIRAYSSGSGEVNVTSTGSVTGVNADGVFASNSASGTDLTISTAGVVTGATNGIYALNSGSGSQSIVVTGTITGGSGSGLSTQTMAGQMTNITLDAGANVSSTAGLGIYNNEGDSNTAVNSGATVSGEIRLNNGSDRLTFAGGDFSAVSVFDGGDDIGTADGFEDVLSFVGSSGALVGASVLNWERVEIDQGSTISFSDGLLTTGTLATINGGILDLSGTSFALTGNVRNGGTVTMQDGLTGDNFNISGDYSGTGMLEMDVDFATDTSDQLIVAGNVTGGTTLIGIADVTTGTATGNNVVVVDVSGTTSAGDFALAGGPITSGVFDYDLEEVQREWVLAGAMNATGAVYEALPLTLAGFNSLPSLTQRVHQRSSTEGQPVWLRFSADTLSAKPDTSSSGLSFDRNQWGLQTGLDFALEPSAAGHWVLGATLQYGQISSNVQNAIGTGKIKSKGYGVGATATFYGDSGFYTDLQGQVNWLDSDITSSTSGSLIEGHDSMAYSLSVEVGKSYSLASAGTLTPQAQLIWGRVDGNSFTDAAGNTVVPGNNESLVGRLGLTYQSESTGRGQFYVLGNVLHDFSGAQTTNVAGTTLSARSSDTWGEIGIGGNFLLTPNQKLFGELRYRQALGGGGNNGVSLSAGYTMSF